MTTILHLSASTRGGESATDLLAEELLERLTDDSTTVVHRRLVEGVPQLSVAATSELVTPAPDRSDEAAPVLTHADALIGELQNADVLVIGAPIYNFGPPSALKAWADLVARAGTTFTYTETGPAGLLEDRPTYIVSASGGTPIGSEIDFGTTWLRQFLGFLGIQNITVIGANGLAMDPEAGLAAARSEIAAVPARAA
ncbi:MAG: NAD(P)H-dependent oxidoreductase [Actinomycetota bacterium]